MNHEQYKMMNAIYSVWAAGEFHLISFWGKAAGMLLYDRQKIPNLLIYMALLI